MSMSTHVIGFKSPSEKWKAMKDVWDACKNAGIDTPDEVDKFFNYEKPDPYGEAIYLKGLDCCKEWKADMEAGFEIDLTKLPENVVRIRFYNSF